MIAQLMPHDSSHIANLVQIEKELKNSVPAWIEANQALMYGKEI